MVLVSRYMQITDVIFDNIGWSGHLKYIPLFFQGAHRFIHTRVWSCSSLLKLKRSSVPQCASDILKALVCTIIFFNKGGAKGCNVPPQILNNHYRTPTKFGHKNTYKIVPAAMNVLLPSLYLCVFLQNYGITPLVSMSYNSFNSNYKITLMTVYVWKY